MFACKEIKIRFLEVVVRRFMISQNTKLESNGPYRYIFLYYTSFVDLEKNTLSIVGYGCNATIF